MNNITHISSYSRYSYLLYLFSKKAFVASKEHYLTDLFSKFKIEKDRNILIITPSAKEQELFWGDLRLFFERNSEFNSILNFPNWEILPFDDISPSIDIQAVRMNCLYQVRNNSSIVVASIESLIRKLCSKELLKQFCIEINTIVQKKSIVDVLKEYSYQKVSLVSQVGEFNEKGSVIDFYSPNYDLPVRLEFFDDELISIRFFNIDTQLSERGKEITRVDLLPISETFLGLKDDFRNVVTDIKSRASDLSISIKEIEPLIDSLRSNLPWPGIEHTTPVYQKVESSFLDYFSSEPQIFFLDKFQCRQRLQAFYEILEERKERAINRGMLFPKIEDAFFNEIDFKSKFKIDSSFDLLDLFENNQADYKLPVPNFDLKRDLISQKSSHTYFKFLAEFLKKKAEENSRIIIVSSYEKRNSRIINVIKDLNLGFEVLQMKFEEAMKYENYQRKIFLIDGPLSQGFSFDEEKLTVISDNEFLTTIVKNISAKKVLTKKSLRSISQLHEGDFVVHEDHGIGIYLGLSQIEVDGRLGDFISLEYKEGGKLHLPIDSLGKLQKYLAKEGVAPQLDKLGSSSWQKSKKKIEESVAALTGGLLSLYASREIVEGFSFGQLTSDDITFADSFPYQETSDQQRAIEEVLQDMSLTKPMDRLVCGDVGFGKTEVALRATYKAVLAGKQVAILVPTTVLAEQHYNTFRERLAEFLVTVGCLNRFRSSKENKENIKLLSEGKIDVMIGTHRLIQKDIVFKNLGLLIIDEEHRFGVAQKEKLKKLRTEIDVLTLTATPIPRTLHMSLSGFRDISIIQSPPYDRKIIKTDVIGEDPQLIREAILREIGREGQVFFIHNRIKNIEFITDTLKELVPEANIRFAHGQMTAHQIENIMHDFVHAKFNVLVSTTIVESGIDIPNANTIIINKAENFGLAELYQLRGRVGRSSKRAYSLLVVSDYKKISKTAKERLNVLRSLNDLGVGFQLAIQDMEIRGVGNLLGKDQSGKIATVGYEMFSRILRKAIEEQRAKNNGIDYQQEVEIDPEIKIGFPNHIPEYYINDVTEKLLLYQRLIEVSSESEILDIFDEINDLYGKAPLEVANLFEVMTLRVFLKIKLITTFRFSGNTISINFHPEARLRRKQVIDLVSSDRKKYSINNSGGLSYRDVFSENELSEVSPQKIHDKLKSFLINLMY